MKLGHAASRAGKDRHAVGYTDSQVYAEQITHRCAAYARVWCVRWSEEVRCTRQRCDDGSG